LLITTDPYVPQLMDTFYSKLINKNVINETNVISKGNTKIMAVAIIDEMYRHLDIFYYPLSVYPFALLFTTGSKEFNVKMRSHALKKGYSLNERNLTHGSPSGDPVTEREYLTKIEKEYPETEEDIFAFLEYPYLSPEKR